MNAEDTKNTETVAMLLMVRHMGAVKCIEALSRALRELGPEWTAGYDAATDIEAVTGHAPHTADDWNSAAEKALTKRGLQRLELTIRGPSLPEKYG